MFIAALFAIAIIWKQPRYPLIGEWINKLVYPDNGILAKWFTFVFIFYSIPLCPMFSLLKIHSFPKNNNNKSVGEVCVSYNLFKYSG